MVKVPFFGRDKYFKENSEEILKRVSDVYNHGMVVMGPEIKEFEEKISSYCGRKYAVVVGSCTDSLYFSLLGNGVKDGDEVLVTDFSFIASATCILRTGAVPVFVDVNLDDYMMDLEDLEKKVTSKTKAIIAVDLFGNSLNINAVEEISNRYGLVVIEDAAQSIGSNYNGRNVGSLGVCSCISFDPTKILGAQGNGGVILTNDFNLYSKFCKMRYHGKNLDTGDFEILGFNSRLSSLQASLLSYNLDKLEGWISRHREIAKMYLDALSDISQIILPMEKKEVRHIYHKFVIKVEERDRLKQFLENNGVETMIHYKNAIHENKLFTNFKYRAEGIVRVNEVKEKVLSLPIYPYLMDNGIEYVIEKIREFYS